MIPNVTREDLLRAIGRFDQEERNTQKWRDWTDDKTHKYAIAYKGSLYPVKEIVALATGVPKPSFGGGTEANKYVIQRGFEVQDLHHNGSARPRSWIFQANPEKYDLAGALAHLPNLTWQVNQHAEEIHAGDRVYLWESGSKAGILGTATILTEPASIPENPDEEPYIHDKVMLVGDRLRVRLRVDCVLRYRLDRQVLREDPVLQGLAIMQMAHRTNFPVTAEQDAALSALIGARNQEPPCVPPPPPVSLTALFQSLRASGLHFSEEIVSNYLLALQAKRFVILTGSDWL